MEFFLQGYVSGEQMRSKVKKSLKLKKKDKIKKAWLIDFFKAHTGHRFQYC